MYGRIWYELQQFTFGSLANIKFILHVTAVIIQPKLILPVHAEQKLSRQKCGVYTYRKIKFNCLEY